MIKNVFWLRVESSYRLIQVQGAEEALGNSTSFVDHVRRFADFICAFGHRSEYLAPLTRLRYESCNCRDGIRGALYSLGSRLRRIGDRVDRWVLGGLGDLRSGV